VKVVCKRVPFVDHSIDNPRSERWRTRKSSLPR